MQQYKTERTSVKEINVVWFNQGALRADVPRSSTGELGWTMITLRHRGMLGVNAMNFNTIRRKGNVAFIVKSPDHNLRRWTDHCASIAEEGTSAWPAGHGHQTDERVHENGRRIFQGVQSGLPRCIHHSTQRSQSVVVPLESTIESGEFTRIFP